MLTKHTPRTYIRTTRCPVCKKGQIEETTVFNGGITTIIEKTCSNLLCTSHIKKETELEKRFNKATQKELQIYHQLDLMINDIQETGVDVSYFPEEAQIILLNYAKKLSLYKQ